MEKELDLYTAGLDEIVFEDRNKSYGGYFLRVWYEKNVTKAVLITCVAFVVVAASIFFYYKFTAVPEEVYVPVVIDMKMADKPLDPEEVKKQEPQPPKVEEPKVEQIKFVVPIIKPDKEVLNEDQMKDQKLLLDGNISDKDVKGDTGQFVFEEGDDKGEIGGTGTEKPDEVFLFAQQMPRFRGAATEIESQQAIQKYIQNRVVFPEDAKRRGIEGVVFVKYLVSKEGKVTDVQIVKGRGLDPSCDAEAIRVVKSMPDFTPAVQNGVNVTVPLTARIKFTLSEK